MCGIIAVHGRLLPSQKSPQEISKANAAKAKQVEEALEQLASGLADTSSATYTSSATDTSSVTLLESAQFINSALKGAPGVTMLLENEFLENNLELQLPKIEDQIKAKSSAQLGSTNPEVKAPQNSIDWRFLSDLIFNIKWDRLELAKRVKRLLKGEHSPSAINSMTSVETALAGIDRLEVRGRDSAGIQILLYGGTLVKPQTYIYKVASEIGKLGDNTTELRQQIFDDEKLLAALAGSSDIQASVLAHTRWASVGLISLDNAHPQDSLLATDLLDPQAVPDLLATSVINGDIDNYSELIKKYNLEIPEGTTTDSKIVPALIAKDIATSASTQESLQATRDVFQQVTSELEGSLAIATTTMLDPQELHLSLSGSGQGLYVGLDTDTFIVASEPYGLVAVADRYLRLTEEIVHLCADDAGTLAGIHRFSRDGKPLPVGEDELVEREISTQDIHRGKHPHLFIKEICEAPNSVQKTLDGSLFKSPDGQYVVNVGEEALSAPVLERLTSGQLKRIYVIGQGTAGVAARAVADAIAHQLPALPIKVEPILASELSSFALEQNQDMYDALVVAISQSGTTTDTNRTVELVRSRGAVVIGIVNRRSSDLVDRSDGIFYTSDGRDVEMSVASTKAFYAQAVAGILLACAIGDTLNTTASVDQDAITDRQNLLSALVKLPEAMGEVLELRPQILEIAERIAPSRRWWAVVGSGRDRFAAEEVRIKLSELCYKSIAQDSIEDKKHIDLSSEPLVLVCAGGLSGAIAEDMIKEVAIYSAHKAAPVVFAETAIADRLVGTDTLAIPSIDSRVAFILSALAGHLFSYEAALAIDAGAIPLRQTRGLIENTLEEMKAQNKVLAGEALLTQMQPQLLSHFQKFDENLRRGEYDGHLQVSTGTRLATLYRYVTNASNLESYQLDFGYVGSPAQVLEDLIAELNKAIDELSRPIDAIRHQAKTVTVGISRSDEAFLEIPLVAEVLRAGTPRDQLSYQNLKMLAGLDPVVQEVVGYIRYLIQGDNLTILDRGGQAAQLESRVEKTPLLFGTKHRVTTEQKVLITRGRMDGRTVIIVPEVKNSVPVGLTLLHIKAVDFLPSQVAAEVLKVYKGRYEILKDAVIETEPDFDESKLGEVPILDLLDQPILYLADKWSENE